MAYCTVCEKTTRFGNQRSRSMQHTRRKMKANIQQVGGLVVCTRCLRTLRKHVATAVQQQTVAEAARAETAQVQAS